MKFEHENDYLQVLLDACLNTQLNPILSNGICCNNERFISDVLIKFEDDNLIELISETLEKVSNNIFANWPKFSGSKLFPVPSTNFKSNCDMFCDTNNYWEGAYGDLRKELLQFMIDSLKLALKTK